MTSIALIFHIETLSLFYMDKMNSRMNLMNSNTSSEVLLSTVLRLGMNSDLLAEFLFVFLQSEARAALTRRLQLLHGLQQHLILLLQLEQLTGRQVIHLVTQRFLRHCAHQHTKL